MKQTKKGFTLVELLVVIAILAILATVSIIGYVSFINKAHLSVDQQTTEQMNIVLEAESVLEKPETVDQVREYLEAAGFNTTNGLVPTMEGYTFYWYKTYNVIVLVNEVDGSIYTPVENSEMVAAFQADFANNKKDIYNLDDSIYSDPNRLVIEGAPVAQAPIYELGTSDRQDSDMIEFMANEGWLFTFYPNDETLADDSPYANWLADFAIIFNDDFDAGSGGIVGQYWSLPWTAMVAQEDIAAGTQFLLMQEGFQDTYRIPYSLLVDLCATQSDGSRDGFNCGAFNYSESNLGKSITVQLRLYEVDENNERTGKYIVCYTVNLEFNKVVPENLREF